MRHPLYRLAQDAGLNLATTSDGTNHQGRYRRQQARKRACKAKKPGVPFVEADAA